MHPIQDYIPAASTLLIGAFVLAAMAHWHRKALVATERSLLIQLLGWLAALITLIGFIIALPLSENLQGQILSLIGVVLTAVIALSSTTFVANAMAGVMLQVTEPFRPGDFVKVNGVFGRVTHRALVQTRVQTDTRDFTTLPNMLLVTHPVTVLHREGTIIHADVSLGYDVHHADAERELLAAAAKAELDEPYVLVTDLLDHAVVYRVAGFAADLKNPVSLTSRLRRAVLDALHEADIEITSPSVVAQRQQPGDTRALPRRPRRKPVSDETQSAEDRVFDQGEQAAEREKLRDDLKEAMAAVVEQERLIKSLNDEQKVDAEAVLKRLQARVAWLDGRLNPAGN